MHAGEILTRILNVNDVGYNATTKNQRSGSKTFRPQIQYAQ